MIRNRNQLEGNYLTTNIAYEVISWGRGRGRQTLTINGRLQSEATKQSKREVSLRFLNLDDQLRGEDLPSFQCFVLYMSDTQLLTSKNLFKTKKHDC